jgi:GST-like protein
VVDKNASTKMIDLYTYNTFNGQQVSIALEELGLDYKAHKIDLIKKQQNSDAYLKINPSGRIPAIIDHGVEGVDKVVVSQSMAILLYLAEKTGQLMSANIGARAKTYEWLAFQATDVSTNIFNSFRLKVLIAEPQLKASDILRNRAKSFYKIFDQQLGKTQYLVGDNYSIADISSFTIVNSIHAELPMDEYKNLNRWHQSISKRPAVIRGLAVPI